MVFFGNKTGSERQIDKSDVVATLRTRRLLRRKDLEISCANINALSYREVLELYLCISGVARWQWVDMRGRRSSRLPIVKIFINLIRDYLSWPLIYLRTSLALNRLLKKSGLMHTAKTEGQVLFLRTDHRFNVKSGGSVGHLSGVVNNLREMGYETHIVSTDRLADIKNNELFHLCEPDYRLGRNVPDIPELVYSDQLFQWIVEHWNVLAASFVYQRYSLGNYTGVVLREKYGTPFVCEYNGSFAWMARHWGKKRLFHEKLLNRVELLNLHAADLVVVVSRPMKDELEMRGISGDKILVNPNGVDTERYSPLVDSSAVLKQYNLEGYRVIGFIGTFGKWHGAEVLAESFGRLLHKFPEYRNSLRLFMIGDGLTMPLVHEKLAQYRVGDECILSGLIPQEEGPRYLASCDVLVSPHVQNPDGTPFFGSPTKLFEYMAMGKGIVASDLDQIGEILEHEKTAWMVKPGDVDDLAQGIARLAMDSELRNKLGKAARAEAEQNYTWKKHTENIIAALQDRLGR
jgi:glycosyltransferase involved in cell wall biosynthesis